MARRLSCEAYQNIRNYGQYLDITTPFFYVYDFSPYAFVFSTQRREVILSTQTYYDDSFSDI